MKSLRHAAGAALLTMCLAAALESPATGAELVLHRTPGTSPGVSRSAPAAAGASAARPSDPAAILAAKIKAWKRVPDMMSAKGVDWSPQASRRRGWKPPLRSMERTHIKGLQGITDVDSLGGPPDTMKTAFIRIDFANDRVPENSTGNGRFDLSKPGAAVPPIDRPPHNRNFYLDHLEALNRYYTAQTYGRVVVAGDVWPRNAPDSAYSCTDMADFGPWRFSQSIYPVAADMFHRMMVAADTQSVKRFHDQIPWDKYDRFVIIHAGSDLQSDVAQNSPEDIPSFTIGVSDSEAVYFATAPGETTKVDRAAFIPEHINQDDYFGTINGVIAHECGHNFFGFVDLYDVESGFPVVGLWSLMDSGNLAGTTVSIPNSPDIYATGLLPPSIDPWQRSFAVKDDREIIYFPEFPYGDTLAIRNSERYPDFVRVSMTSDEYLVLENRWMAPADVLVLDQADSSRVILGPKEPDRFEYDALLPIHKYPDGSVGAGAGILVWHIDESVIPHEFFFPCDTARANYYCGFNTDHSRPAISVVEADGLDDLGDPNSPDILGAWRDPYFKSNNPSLGDTTRPAMAPHIGTKPHVRLDFLDDPDSVMTVAAFRTWQLPGWPKAMPFPPGGPQPLAIDIDGDRLPEVCWAGGPDGTRDTASVIAIHANGRGVVTAAPELVRNLGRKPNPVIAAIMRGNGPQPSGPSVIAVCTQPGGGGTTGRSGRVWLFDETGHVVGGWPPLLEAQVTTPPVIATAFGDTFVYVGCADGKVRALRLDGTQAAQTATALDGPISGRLAVYPELVYGAGAYFAVAAGTERGDVGVFGHGVLAPIPVGMAARGVGGQAPGDFSILPGWPIRVGGDGFIPDFLWIDFGGRGPSVATSTPAGNDCFDGALSLIVHNDDRLWGYCISGQAIPGWGQPSGDTIVPGLAAGDPDADGFPEVITQSVSSQMSYWNVDGHRAPGWPRSGTNEFFRSGASPLALDLDRGGRTQTIAMNASGIVDAFDVNGKQPDGWPLGSGLGATGTPLIADLNGDHYLELVVPDAYGFLYAYTLPTRDSALVSISWPMLGGDPQRSSGLPSLRTAPAPPPVAGPFVPGTLKAYPNPARRKPVQFAYTMTEPGEVEFRILDTSGHEVASFTRRARQSDNVEVWDPGSLPAGLYVARLKFKGANTDHVESIPLGLLR